MDVTAKNFLHIEKARREESLWKNWSIRSVQNG